MKLTFLGTRGGAATIFYVPDVLELPDRGEALRNIKVYIGDGATITRPLVRQRGPQATGHTSVSTQLGWCAQEGVRHAIFTHCGTPVVSKAAEAERQIAALALTKGIEVQVAYDGLQIVVR
jgi:phosphoribosyl 1,2-cyclic phosphodiesterase